MTTFIKVIIVFCSFYIASLSYSKDDITMLSGINKNTSDNTILQAIKSDKWAIATGSYDKLPIVFRVRSNLKPKPDTKNYQHLVQIIWLYESNDSGMPNHEHSKLMGLFEDRLCEAVESDASAILVAVETAHGSRKWSYYSNNVQEFANKITNMPQEKERYPIELTTKADPTWDYYYKHLSGIIKGL